MFQDKNHSYFLHDSFSSSFSLGNFFLGLNNIQTLNLSSFHSSFIYVILPSIYFCSDSFLYILSFLWEKNGCLFSGQLWDQLSDIVTIILLCGFPFYKYMNKSMIKIMNKLSTIYIENKPS